MDNQASNTSNCCIHLPVALVALSLAILFYGQITTFRSTKEIMTLDIASADKQIEEFKKVKEQLAKTIEDRKPTATGSAELQTRFAVLMKKVAELSQGDDGDPDAKKLISILAGMGVTGINVPDNLPAATQPK